MKSKLFLLMLWTVYSNATEIPVIISGFHGIGIYELNGGDYIGLRQTYVCNGIEYGIFNLGDGNQWRYKKNDIIYLDSSTVKVLDVNHDSGEVTVTKVSFIQNSSDTTYFGIWRDNHPYGVLEKGFIKLTDNTLSNATFRYYKMDYKKIFSFNDDTCIIEGKNLTYLHIKDESLPVVNCRDITLKGSSVNVEPNFFCIKIPCNSDEIHIDGEHKENMLEVTIEIDNFNVTKNLFYRGKVDSSNITLSLNDTYFDQSNEVAINLDWSVTRELNNFAGFKIFYNPSLSNQKFYSVLKNRTSKKAHESGLNYNILGKKLSDIDRHPPCRIEAVSFKNNCFMVISQNKKGL